jgi:hypothetical protein
MSCWCGRQAVQVVRKRAGWVRLCAGHWEIEWRYWPPARQRTWLRREKKRRHMASAKERRAKRAAARKLDGTEGRKKRYAAAGRPSRPEADKRKREMCAESERQTKPWEALGISRATYYRDKLHGQSRAVRPGSVRQKALLITKLAPTVTPPVGASIAGDAHQPHSLMGDWTQNAGNTAAGAMLFRTNPHRFARGPQRNSVGIQP